MYENVKTFFDSIELYDIFMRALKIQDLEIVRTNEYMEIIKS